MNHYEQQLKILLHSVDTSIYMASMHVPSPLTPEAPPTRDDLLEGIEEWVIYHLIRTAQSNLHYENYLYGPVNALLGEIFPVSRRYMVIPQALMRRPLTDDEISDHSDVSFGSTGGAHESRELPGTEHFKQFPDFAIVKVTPQPGMARNHYIVGIIELKKAPSFGEGDVRQMGRYMRQAAQLPNSANPLYGYLVVGDRAKKFVARRTRGTVRVDIREFDVDQLSGREDIFFKDLCRVSVTHWNYQA